MRKKRVMVNLSEAEFQKALELANTLGVSVSDILRACFRLAVLVKWGSNILDALMVIVGDMVRQEAREKRERENQGGES